MSQSKQVTVSGLNNPRAHWDYCTNHDNLTEFGRQLVEFMLNEEAKPPEGFHRLMARKPGGIPHFACLAYECYNRMNCVLIALFNCWLTDLLREGKNPEKALPHTGGALYDSIAGYDKVRGFSRMCLKATDDFHGINWDAADIKIQIHIIEYLLYSARTRQYYTGDKGDEIYVNGNFVTRTSSIGVLAFTDMSDPVARNRPTEFVQFGGYSPEDLAQWLSELRSTEIYWPGYLENTQGAGYWPPGLRSKTITSNFVFVPENYRPAVPKEGYCLPVYVRMEKE